MLLLTGCASTIETQVVGPYASRLSASDLDQLKDLAYSRFTVDRRFIKLEAIKANQVRVEATSYEGSGWTRSRFTSVRRGGHWVLDQKSEAVADVERSVTTY
jgi:hypothetical protein